MPQRIFQIAFNIIVAVLLVVDAVARPLYQPILNWFKELAIVARLETEIAKLPRFAILVLFAVPFVIAEPLKLYALLLIPTGHLIYGLFLLAMAYLLTFLLVERIYHAGKDKLLTYGWLAWAMKHVSTIRDMVVAKKNAAVAELKRWLSGRST